MSPDEALTSALASKGEAANLDFKAAFNVASNRDWLELIKDIAAFANSGGGHILVGVDDDGSPSGSDASQLLAVDPADVGNRLHKYLGQHFAGVQLVSCMRDGIQICAVRVAPVRIPLVFARVGEVELPDGKKKTIFALGTTYFRHGAKSEPGTSEDMRQFLEREIERTRKSWLDGIAKVVEAPSGSRVAILPPESAPTGPSGTLPIQLTSEPGAPAYYAVPLDQTHPHRQKEVVQEVNARLAGKRTINMHDIICVRRVYSIQKQIQYCYTQNYASPRYSQQFVDWIVQQYLGNKSFFEETRAKFDKLKAGGAA